MAPLDPDHDNIHNGARFVKSKSQTDSPPRSERSYESMLVARERRKGRKQTLVVRNTHSCILTSIIHTHLMITREFNKKKFPKDDLNIKCCAIWVKTHHALKKKNWNQMFFHFIFQKWQRRRAETSAEPHPSSPASAMIISTALWVCTQNDDGKRKCASSIQNKNSQSELVFKSSGLKPKKLLSFLLTFQTKESWKHVGVFWLSLVISRFIRGERTQG